MVIYKCFYCKCSCFSEEKRKDHEIKCLKNIKMTKRRFETIMRLNKEEKK